MSNEILLEERVTTLERLVSDLQQQLEEQLPFQSSEPKTQNWLDNLIGSIPSECEEAFLEALEYGRTFRQSDRPDDES